MIQPQTEQQFTRDGAFLSSRGEVQDFIVALPVEERVGRYINRQGWASFVIEQCMEGASRLGVGSLDGTLDLSIFRQYGVFYGGPDVRVIGDEAMARSVELPPQSQIQFLLLGESACGVHKQLSR